MKLTAIGRLLGGAAAAFGLMVCTAPAAVILSTTSYSENFDTTLSATSVAGAFSSTIGVQAAVPPGGSSSGWDGAKIAGTGATNMNFTVDTGAANSGAIYSYGSAGSGERALGTVASGSNTAAVGVELVNNIGQAITSVSIGYLGEFWRSSTTSQNLLTFAYAVGPSGSATYLTDLAALPFPLLTLVGPLPVTTNGALDGNLPANQAAFSGTIPVVVPQGQSLYLRWQDFNDIGNDAGLAIDNFELTATVVPEPATLTLLGLVGLAVAGGLRRRS
jgi:hypothetical protein